MKVKKKTRIEFCMEMPVGWGMTEVEFFECRKKKACIYRHSPCHFRPKALKHGKLVWIIKEGKLIK